MNIVEFFFGIFRECFNLINVDFFGLGFTWLQFLLTSLVIFVIVSFCKSIVGVGDHISFDSTVYALKKQKEIKNKKREKQVVEEKRRGN